MRVLHVVKTSGGARWAALQAAELRRLGVEVHVALPDATGARVPEWEAAGASFHIAGLDYPVTSIWRLPAVCAQARELVRTVAPDLIHCHHVGPALLLRLALGKRHPAPRIFQVPGPLHLEHRPYRIWDLKSAGDRDFWIASSRCTRDIYLRAGVDNAKLFLSYYGFRSDEFDTSRSGLLRARLGIASHDLVVGNISYVYGPKYYLGQRVGLKCHEDLIAALGLVLAERSDVRGLLIGGPWGGAAGYFRKLRRHADAVGRGRILMPGFLPLSEVQRCWPDFDCAIHVPLSENCGGVVEPLLAGVPVIAGRVGGLPEVVQEGLTGALVPVRNPRALAAAILRVLDQRERYRPMARSGGELVREMFDVRRTAAEVYEVYRHILDRGHPRPREFDSRAFLEAAALTC
ncbi:MAG TPA: glycosyltransferase family 4 protein [Bryobacteraceae bacterium]|nr:glycosyltransferase family 4 protein [Bryobacteraceae bacterium]